MGSRPGSSTVQQVQAPTSLEATLQLQAEVLERFFDHVPLLVDITGPDCFIKYVNRQWEHTIGWTRQEILEQNLDIYAACFPDPEQRRRALDFVSAANEEWREFRHLGKDRQEIYTAWIAMRLPNGMVLGLGVDSSRRHEAQQALQDNRHMLSGPLFESETASTYLRRLFAPPCPVHANLILTSIAARGADWALFLRSLSEKRTFVVTVPKVLVDLSARHGSADLLTRMIHHKIGPPKEAVLE